MKDIILILMSFSFITTANADETIQLKGKLEILRCVTISKNQSTCKMFEAQVEPIAILLEQPPGVAVAYGYHKFEVSLEGVEFVGRVDVTKIVNGNRPNYEINTLMYTKLSDELNWNVYFLGDVNLDHYNNLNPISFTGQDIVLQNGMIRLRPYLFIDSM